jgi:hypothetical protein
MNFLTPDDLNALIELVESNNQYNDEDDKEFWDDVLIRLNQTSRHCLDVCQLPNCPPNRPLPPKPGILKE